MRTIQEVFDVVLANDLYPLPDKDYPAMCPSISRAWLFKLITADEEQQAIDDINSYLDKLGGGYRDSAYLQRQLAATFNLKEWPPVEVMLAIYSDWDNRPTSIAGWHKLLSRAGFRQENGELIPTKPDDQPVVNHNLEPHLIGDFWVESDGRVEGIKAGPDEPSGKPE